jgi:hypothetical protein
MMTIIGGTYDESCFEPYWKERFGSGLRACWVVHTLSDSKEPIEFYTFGDPEVEIYLNHLQPTLISKLHVEQIKKTILFHYDHPLASPRIFPRPDLLDKETNTISVSGDNILYYGFIEGSAVVSGKKVVYDPQSPVLPIAFSETGSTAEELCYVVNFKEAQLLSGKSNIEEILRFFFETEKSILVVLKMGPKGALVATNEGHRQTIPVYETNSVWPIGSGDVFAAAFAYHWFELNDVIKAAEEASWQTATYCNTKNFQLSPINTDQEIIPLAIEDFPRGQVYLAGPFFTFAERWLVNEVRSALIGMGLKVFSPWHDVGHGIASEVVSKDIDALEESSIVFAILDGLDSGTLFEIGYAIKKGIPVVGYVENESSESIKMLEGTHCNLLRDLTTSVYKCFWKLAENE